MSAATFEARVHHAYPVAGVSGVALMLVQGQRPWQERWLDLKILLMIAIVANAALQFQPRISCCTSRRPYRHPKPARVS